MSPLPTDALTDPKFSGDPFILLNEAKRLSLLFNARRAHLLFARSEQLFDERQDAENAAYARIGRIATAGAYSSVVAQSRELEQMLGSRVVNQNPWLRLWCLTSKGYVDANVRSALAKDDWEQAKSLARQLKEAQWEARATGELSIVAFLEGNLTNAATGAADSLMSAFASGDRGNQVRLLSLMGCGLTELGRYKDAEPVLARALRIAESTPDMGFPAMALECKGHTLRGEKRFTEAHEIMATTARGALENEMLTQAADLLVYVGEIESDRGDLQPAVAHLEQSIDIAQRMQLNRILAMANADLAETFQKLGNLPAAEQSAAHAMLAARLINDRVHLPRYLTLLGEVEAGGGDTLRAKASFRNAEDIFESILSSIHEPYWMSGFGKEDMARTYREHFQLEAAGHNSEGAFQVIERIRGRTARALLLGPEIHNKPELSKFEGRIAELQLQLMHSDDPAEREKFLEDLFEEERRSVWPEEAEAHFAPRWVQARPSLRSLQISLHDNELVLEYVLMDPHSYCIWISKNHAGVESLKTGSQIEAMASDYLASIRAEVDRRELAGELYDALLAPMSTELGKNRLVIVADGILHFLPFETLLTPSGSMVIENHIVSYAPGGSIIQVLRGKPKPAPSRTLLGIGDVFYQDQAGSSKYVRWPVTTTGRILRRISDLFKTKFEDLPGTRAELYAVAEQFPDDAVLLMGKQATEVAFKAEPLENFGVIHFAVHGFTDTENPQRSGLVLGIDGEGHDDGLLQLREIMRLRFSADLVTLSACDTALGTIEGEEGVTTLAEAFLVRGATAVVASLWNVDDNSTRSLMQSFYASLAAGEDKAGALRDAKLAMIRHGRDATPLYNWAGFVLIGDGALPLNRPKSLLTRR